MFFFHLFDSVEIDKVGSCSKEISSQGGKQIRLEIEREPLERRRYLDGVLKMKNRNCLEMRKGKFPNHEVFLYSSSDFMI